MSIEQSAEQLPSSFHDHANDFVYELEHRRLEELMADMYEARDRSAKCGCGQCRQNKISTYERYWLEYERVMKQPPMDQEEASLMALALLRLDEIQEKRKKPRR